MAKARKGKRMQMFGQVTVPPTPERIARGEMQMVRVEILNDRDFATRDLRQTALDRFWRDQLLSPEGEMDLGRARYDAGTKLAQLHEASGMRQRETGVYGPRENAFEELTDEQAAAFSAYNGVVRMLRGRSIGAAVAVVDLCVHDQGRVDRRLLLVGLDLLVRHWGLD